MRRTRREDTERAAGSSDRALWQQCRATDAPEDDGERFLDLAGFVEGRLDADESARIEAFLAADPALADDVAACGRLALDGLPPEAPEHVVARACALAAAAPAGPSATASPAAGTLAAQLPEGVIRFTPRVRPPQGLAGVARWGSLAAAIAVASWVGFAMGSNTSLALSGLNGALYGSESGPLPNVSLALGGSSQPDQAFINELFDPSTGFLPELTDNSQT